jgi:carbon monoxide dehydrogenase subunit G
VPVPDFVHEIELLVPRDRVRSFLCDLHNHRDLHPLIVSVEDLASDPARPSARRYHITDRVPLGPVGMTIVYTAAVEALDDALVRGEAWQSPGIHLTTEYELTEMDGGTRLVERVRVEAPWLLRRFTIRKAREAHRAMLDRMKALLESQGSP